MPENPDRELRLFQEEMRFALEAGYWLVSQGLVIDIETRERWLDVEGDPESQRVAQACLALAKRMRPLR